MPWPLPALLALPQTPFAVLQALALPVRLRFPVGAGLLLTVVPPLLLPPPCSVRKALCTLLPPSSRPLVNSIFSD